MPATDHIEQPYLFPEYEPATQEMQRELDAFLWNPALDTLAAHYRDEPLPEDPQGRLTALQEIAAEHLDWRKGKPRDVADLTSELPADEDRLLREAGAALHMADTTAPEDRFPDWLLVPGGLNEAARNRLKLGLMTVRPKAIAALAASRELSDKERERVASWAGTEVKTEFDVTCAALAELPNAQLIGETTENRNGDVWRIRKYVYTLDTVGHDRPVYEAYAICAPAKLSDGKGGERNANSHDNFRCFADGVGIRPGLKVAIATTGIYVPLQHLTGVEEMAPYGYEVQTFGHDAAFGGVERKGKQFGQEIKSGIDAAVSLHSAIARRKAPPVA